MFRVKWSPESSLIQKSSFGFNMLVGASILLNELIYFLTDITIHIADNDIIILKNDDITLFMF